MNRLFPILVILLCLPLAGFGGTLYTYTGEDFDCPGGTCQITVNLLLSGPLTPGESYYNTLFGITSPTGVPPGANLLGAPLSWSISDGIHTIANGTPGADILLYFALPPSSPMPDVFQDWAVSAMMTLPSGEPLTMGTFRAFGYDVDGVNGDGITGSASADGTWSVEADAAVPEPSTFVLLGLPIAAALLLRRRSMVR